MKYGTFFDQSAVRNASTYAVIGPQTAEELQMPENPVGEIIRIQNMPFVIIGVTKERGDSAMGSQDDMVIIPITTLKKRLITFIKKAMNQISPFLCLWMK